MEGSGNNQQSEELIPQPVNKNKSLTYILVFSILILLIILGGSLFFYQHINTVDQKREKTPIPTPTLSSSILSDKNLLVFSESIPAPIPIILDEHGKVLEKIVPPDTHTRYYGWTLSLDKTYLFYDAHYDPSPAGCLLTDPPTCVPSTPHLTLYNLTTHAEETILPGVTEFSQPTWSPDSKQLVLVTYKSGIGYITVYSLQDKKQKSVSSVHFSQNISSSIKTQDNITWDPSGQGLYISIDKIIYYYSFATDTTEKLTAGEYPRLTTDGAYLLFIKDNTLHAFDLKQKTEKIITSTITINKYTADLPFAVIPNSHSIIYATYFRPHPEFQNPDPHDESHIYVFNLDTFKENEILTGKAMQYIVSPDGKRIAYRDFSSADNGKQYLYDLATKQHIPFLNNLDGQIEEWR